MGPLTPDRNGKKDTTRGRSMTLERTIKTTIDCIVVSVEKSNEFAVCVEENMNQSPSSQRRLWEAERTDQRKIDANKNVKCASHGRFTKSCEGTARTSTWELGRPLCLRNKPSNCCPNLAGHWH